MRLTICPKCGTLSLVGYCGSGPDNLLYLVSLDRMGRTGLSRLASLRTWSPVREVGKIRPQRPVVPHLPSFEESRAASGERKVPRNLAGGSRRRLPSWAVSQSAREAGGGFRVRRGLRRHRSLPGDARHPSAPHST